ncbi:MAG TPA: hypothetical protein PKK10_04065 [Woeseiaceae bacterium]|nr:hypothetical protein [Woeseiaceae bacterium]
MRKTIIVACVLFGSGPNALASGVPPGTVIENQATVSFDLGGTPTTLMSNTTSLTVNERIDVAAVLQSAQVLTAAGDTERALLFRVTNTGNGTEAFTLAIDNLITGDDFDPEASVPSIYFDTDGSGDLSAADQAYVAGTNEPVLATDAFIDVFLVNDIPVTAVNGDIGRSQLTVKSVTGTGAAGTVYAGAGDGGTEAIIGASTGEAVDVGEYIVADVQINVLKSQVVGDPFGGTEPIPGATITYTIAVDVTGSGTATASVLNDPVPAFSSYVAGSLRLNAVALTDATDADAGELDTTAAPAVVVRLGDLTLADGTQTIEFQVRIDE